MSSQFLQENAMGNSVKGFTKVQGDPTVSPSLPIASKEFVAIQEVGGEDSSNTRSEIPLQSVEKTMAKQVVTLQPVEDPMLEQVDMP
ncbi:protein Wnt-4a-like [Grus japonensis]|uniref:Protein Wnt-4a-like n=1 Tax=Grus japonensis TaxID=30415 RepID=A0ABC9WM11_GRUJA